MLWRITIKPDCEQGVDAAEFCIQRNLLGIGWRVDILPATKEEYWKRGEELNTGKDRRGWAVAANAVLYRMSPGDLVWTRNRNSAYYLGKITSDWQYAAGEDFIRADIANVRSCHWEKVGTMDFVPGSVINSFRPAASVQQVSDESAAEYSRLLFAHLHQEPLPPADHPAQTDILQLLSDADLEDVVAIYIQVVKRCVMFPTTCKKNTMTVECLFAAMDDGQRIGMQVKSGGTWINRDDYARFDGPIYLFAACGQYIGSRNNKCVCIEPSTIRTFICQHRRLMPGRVQRWIDFAEARRIS